MRKANITFRIPYIQNSMVDARGGIDFWVIDGDWIYSKNKDGWYADRVVDPEMWDFIKVEDLGPYEENPGIETGV